MKRFQVTAFGPIHQADVTFGDLTVLVRQQATGKSLFLRLYKLIQDAHAVAADLGKHGLDWQKSAEPVGDLGAHYFGAGFEGIISQSTEILRDGRRAEPLKFVHSDDEAVYLIPAQRSRIFDNGYPQPFKAFDAGESYTLRHFSECIRVFMERLPDGTIQDPFALPELRKAVAASIYADSTLELERAGPRRRIVLRNRGSAAALPYGSWSRGQQEFTPLLLGLAALVSKTVAGEAKTIILEKPETGLHPQAVLSVGLLVLELLARNHRVIVSTHSPVVLDLVWAMCELSSVDSELGIAALSRIFNVDKPSSRIREIFEAALRKDYRTYLFKRSDAGVVTEDISALDPGAENEDVAGWGGLAGVSGRVARIVGEVVVR